MADTLLELKGVSIRRGIDIVLSDFNLSLAGGQCIILHGENGSGKSTVIEAAARLLPMEKGEVRHHLNMVHDSEGRRKNPKFPFGLTLQSNGLVPSQTIQQHLETVCALSQFECDLTPILESYGLSHRRHDKIAHLSGGQQRKVSVISGLIPAMLSEQPRLILLDEPDSGLDDYSIEILKTHINQLRSSGHGILIATHDERLFECATSLHDLNEETKHEPKACEPWKPIGKQANNSFLATKMGWKYNASTLISIQRNWLASLLVIGTLLALVEPLSIKDHDVLVMGFVLAPAFTIGLVGDSVTSILQEQRAIDWWRAQVQSIPNSNIESFLSGCILTIFSMQVFLQIFDWRIVLIGGIIGFVTTFSLRFLQLSTLRLARTNAVFIRLLTPILILPWAMVVEYCVSF
ncbi:MAG: ATP-binding cassette domain-containing protein [Candidatus Poseidoniaceae archaeon]|jgi:ABC-type Mn2+/Zn2+ transport system ATPase subunit|nr:ATP-binding cassette domain-containing protein [Candidatus Poseidoniaceae archaeon]